MAADPRALIAERMRASRRIAVTSHLRPDGDSLCTARALALMGGLLGKDMAVVNRDPTPLPFSHFPDLAGIRIGQIRAEDFDTVILLECADVSRSGQENLGAVFKINIDHHHSNSPYADINWIDPEAPAVGEMVFDLAGALGVGITPEIAENLYCAIASDTGSFQFSNTTTRALAAASDLSRLGASPNKVAEKLYYNNAPEKILLLGRVLSTLTMNGGGTIAVISMFKSDTEALGLKEVDTEDMTTLARSIQGVEMVMFFKEMGPETFRVSLRSKGSANAARVAEHFGGGGHIHASGFTVHGPYDRLIRDVPAAVEGLLAADRAGSAGPAR
ncbi:MAG: bifunctional oligoribonuclease/PAP phosphatase NrnA [Candidatus Aminicenantes bacterium]|nr:bifunctional oligoribonuclease/PAP phosphatase NrnA [Candidatus Aminicenantes bacterium]